VWVNCKLEVASNALVANSLSAMTSLTYHRRGKPNKALDVAPAATLVSLVSAPTDAEPAAPASAPTAPCRSCRVVHQDSQPDKFVSESDQLVQCHGDIVP
jgi:hypothetical protein